MSKTEKRAQTFLYFGVLMALIAADWHWYLGAVYVLWLAAMVLCFVGSLVFFWKTRKQEEAYQHKKRKQH